MSPATDRLRGTLRGLLQRLGLLPAARRCRELMLIARFAGPNRRYLRRARESWPVPPASLRILVAASPDVAWFLESGRRGADVIRTTLEKNGIAFEHVLPILDFGCGCGRVVRHFSTLRNAVYGTDVHPDLVAWCRRHLQFASFDTNALVPPTRFRDEQFGLIYAFSVFTHLPENLQQSWICEMRRILRPGGYLLLTTHGTRYLTELDENDRLRFAQGQLVVRRADDAGGNVCGAYHPEDYVRRRLTEGFTVIDFVPEGALGNPWQDVWLLRRHPHGSENLELRSEN